MTSSTWSSTEFPQSLNAAKRSYHGRKHEAAGPAGVTTPRRRRAVGQGAGVVADNSGVADTPARPGTGDGSPEPRWLTQEEQRAWRAYLRGHRLLQVALDQALRPHGLSLSEFEIIAMLSEAPGRRLRMSELADIVTQSRSMLTHTAARLETRGWVERIPYDEDKRGVEICLTPLGFAHLEAAARVHVESVRDSLVDLVTPQQFAVIGEAMGTVETVLRARMQADRTRREPARRPDDRRSDPIA